MTDLSRLSKLHIRETKVCLYKEGNICELNWEYISNRLIPKLCFAV